MRYLIILAILLVAIPTLGNDVIPWAETHPIVGVEHGEFIKILETAGSCLTENEYLRHVIVRKDDVLIGTSLQASGNWEVGPTIVLKQNHDTWECVGEEKPSHPSYKNGISFEAGIGVLQQLPANEQYLSIKVKTDNKLWISTGVVDSPMGGGGKSFRFTKKGGVWELRDIGAWII